MIILVVSVLLSRCDARSSVGHEGRVKWKQRPKRELGAGPELLAAHSIPVLLPAVLAVVSDLSVKTQALFSRPPAALQLGGSTPQWVGLSSTVSPASKVRP